MFLELSVAYPPSKADQRHLVGRAMELGYDGIVFAQTVTGDKFTTKLRNTMTPIDLVELSTPPLRQSSTLRLSVSLSSPFPHTAAATSNDSRLRSAFQQKFRLNLELNDVSALPASAQSLTQWDIVAAKASSESMFHSLCSYDCIDIITVECIAKQPFHIKRPSINLAVQNGLQFELTYSGAIKDGMSRRYLFAAAQALMRVCPNRAIVLSSGCDSASGNEMRSPHDGINVLRLMGFNDREARDAVSTNAERALWHGETRRTAKGALRAVKEKPTIDQPSAKRAKNEHDASAEASVDDSGGQ